MGEQRVKRAASPRAVSVQRPAATRRFAQRTREAKCAEGRARTGAQRGARAACSRSLCVVFASHSFSMYLANGLNFFKPNIISFLVFELTNFISMLGLFDPLDHQEAV